ncbi:intradiol ring-cleavage dioxygenase [Plantactinospora sp. KBS50]|uniref:intradiol ring-cleavage dioxygenase n=1 Tax=Plantactinospora sp. KBS50 TaxID=2024580 RepID=UPI000BAB1400|nr:intradiol ring-cleavage dioxygenase [Plantactinospora sp. KBS50]ASW57144.1 dioxygenase [Plantactinospora sp. KBS50]
MAFIDASDEPDNGDVSRALLSRRRLLSLGGAGVAAAGLAVVGGRVAVASAAAATGQPVPAAEAACACVLSSESIEGPYYLDYLLMRRDVVEDREGVPLTLNLRVIDSDSCRPLPGAGVEIWHCDALGVYSGYTSNGSGGGGMPPPDGTPPAPPSGDPSVPPSGDPSAPPGGGGNPGGHATPTDDLTYLRGIQLADHAGRVTFTSIVPGWYAGRAVHIHTKVHAGGTVTSSGYQGGHTCHTGQFYFPESLITEFAGIAPYSTNQTRRTLLDEDNIYDGSGATGGLLDVRYDRRHVARGVRATLTLSVDPTATHDGQDGGGPGGPPPGSPSPSPSA